jgi:uncharacterized protein YciI
MPQYAISCIDRAGALETRLATRPAHGEYIRSHPGVKLAGPYSNAAGDPVGSLIIVEADDLAAVQAFCANDPYAKAGVFETVDIRPFKLVIGAL